MKLPLFTWIPLLALAAFSHAAPVQIDFSNNAGLGFGSGTTQTIAQNGIEMSVLSGRYEITTNPNHELNLKDFSGSDGARTVQFDLLSGLNFDFIGLSRQDAFGNATITSDRGGNITFGLSSPLDFSGAAWDDLQWIRVTTSQQFGEFKFNSFTFDDAPTVTNPVPEPSSLALLAASGLAAVWSRRRVSAQRR